MRWRSPGTEAPFCGLSSMVFIELTDGQKTKLALVEKLEVFLEMTCSGRNWATVATNIQFCSLWKCFATRTRVD